MSAALTEEQTEYLQAVDVRNYFTAAQTDRAVLRIVDLLEEGYSGIALDGKQHEIRYTMHTDNHTHVDLCAYLPLSGDFSAMVCWDNTYDQLAVAVSCNVDVDTLWLQSRLDYFSNPDLLDAETVRWLATIDAWSEQSDDQLREQLSDAIQHAESLVIKSIFTTLSP